MTDQNKNINHYTAIDFERYYAGKMSPQEMHLLEKAALDDPFLEDALEGYRLSAAPVKDIEALQARLNSNKKDGKIIPLKQAWYSAPLWKVTAMVVLTAGLGWIIYNFSFSQKSSNEIAVADKTTTQLSEPATSAKEEKQSDTAVAAPTQNINIDIVSAAPGAGKKTPSNEVIRQSVQLKKDDGTIASLSNSKSDNTTLQTNTAEIDATAANAPAAVLESDTNNSVAIGYGTQKRVSVAQENRIVLEKTKQTEIQEVVIGKSKRDSNYQRHRVSFEEAEPVNGVSNYNDYVLQNLQPKNENQKKPAGEVKLSFEIDNNGQAVNINVEKSLCKDCDLEAIRILKDGPKWLSKNKNKKGKLTIRF